MNLKRMTVLIWAGLIAGAFAWTFAATAKELPSDPGWPRVYSNGVASIAVHQPQVDSWTEYNLLKARSAVEITSGKDAKPVIAAVSWEAQTGVDKENRTIRLTNFRITGLRAPSLKDAEAKSLQDLATSLLPKQSNILALDRALAYVDDQRPPVAEVKVSIEAPPILVSKTPAVLVMIDGPPMLGEIKGTKLSYVMNTNWDLFKEAGSKEHYLLNQSQWLIADALEGPYAPTKKLPKEFSKIPAEENWADVRKALPIKSSNAKRPAPMVHVVNKPSELILIQGEPHLEPIPGTEISNVVNTESNLFFHRGEQKFYFLTSGRWFRTPTLIGRWEPAAGQLPSDFQKIPGNHPRAAVLASVPGTVAAQDAVMLAAIPQAAVISRKDAGAQASAKYIGDPSFKPIIGTNLEYAANTPADVIRHENKYYLLQQGVWFVAAAPIGPWETADMVPQEIYRIPPESPKHHTTYVYVTDSTKDTVTYAHTSGYMGTTVSYGVVMWGTGWYYPPYYYYGAMYPYPIYWPPPFYTYGAAAWYNPYTGFYGRGAVAYGPYGGYARSAAYNPVTGAYVRRGAAWGPYQAGVASSFYNPRTGAYGGGYRYANPYQGWGEGVVHRGGEWAKGGYYYDERGAIGGIKTSDGGRLVAAGNGDKRVVAGRTAGGDAFVGKDGNVYKRDQSGGWYKHDEGGWNQIDRNSLTSEQRQRVDQAKSKTSSATAAGTSRQRPSPTTMQRPTTASADVMGGLQRDSSARSRGNQNYGSWSSGSSRARTNGGYGGGRSGGFGRRR